MIHITINRKKTGSIQSFVMSGHAQFAEHGQDIVCAGASAVSFGTINELTGVTPEIEQSEVGFLTCVIPENLPESSYEKIQILLEGMVVSLQTIEEQYGEHIKLS